jgi:hypothetical protein
MPAIGVPGEKRCNDESTFIAFFPIFDIMTNLIGIYPSKKPPKVGFSAGTFRRREAPT